VFTGGRIVQGPGGMLKDNNDLCLAMNMVLPMIFYMGQASTKPRVRRGCLIATGLTMVTVIITTSRGGMLTLAGVLFLIVIKSNKKFIGLSVGTFALLMILLFMPADVKERLATLKDPTAESSAMGRLFAWGIAFDMAQDRPIFGVGFENFVPKFRRYAPRYLARDVKGVSSIRVTHNSYLQLLAEVGFPALFFFLAMILSTIFMMRRLRREVRARDGPRWVHFYAHMIEVSLLAFMGGAMFLNRSHFDLLYHVVALGGVVYLLGRKALRGDLVEEQEAPEKFPELRHVPSYPNLARP
jgi:probable O-glycosylation ligase (exosortase A-associated)